MDTAIKDQIIAQARHTRQAQKQYYASKGAEYQQRMKLLKSATAQEALLDTLINLYYDPSLFDGIPLPEDAHIPASEQQT